MTTPSQRKNLIRKLLKGIETGDPASAAGDFVFAHTEYDFATRRIGFEVFRFEADQAIVISRKAY